MSDFKKKPEFGLSIVSVRELSFFIKENLVVREKQNEIIVQFIGRTGFSIEHDFFNFTLKTWYHYADNETEIAQIEVENIFSIPNLKNFIGPNEEVNFPPQAWVTMVSLSISHSRSLFARNLAGTKLNNAIIAIVNPVDVTKEFFPHVFQEQKSLTDPKI